MNNTLTDDPPMILDSTCSFSRNWPKHASIRMDFRAEVKPDKVGDIRNTDFPDNMFDIVYCDPPHMIRKDPFILPHDRLTIKRRLSGRTSPGSFTRYHAFKDREEWIDFVERTNKEIHRILKPGGLLEYKATFGKDRRFIKREDLDLYTNFEVINEKITKSKQPGSKNLVHWITFRGSSKSERRIWNE